MATLVLLAGAAGWYWGVERPRLAAEQKRKGDLARIEAEAERLKTEQAKQAAADKAKAEQEQHERDRLANAKGGLLLKTAPSGATVTLGGEDVQQSPATFKGVKVGKYPLRLSLEGYEPVSQEVEIKENDFTDLGTMNLERSTGTLLITTDPPDTEYEVTAAQGEGQPRRGDTSGQLKLPTGDYTVRLKRGGWEDRTKTVTVKRNETARLEESYAEGKVRVESQPAGASVEAGGRVLGTTPLDLAAVPAGPVSYRLTLKGYKPSSLSGTIRAKETVKLAAQLEKVLYPTLGSPYQNSLGMKFVPVPGTRVLFSVWDARVQDFEAFVQATGL